jgi:microcompartment protein CcmL/EutN
MPVLAGLDLLHVPAGLAALDAVCKEAPVRVLFAGDIDPGRFLLIFAGDLASVEAALHKGIVQATDALLESLLLPQAHAHLHAALYGNFADSQEVLRAEHALGTLHAHTPLTLLAALDRALKVADVSLLRLRLASELAGQGHAVLAGEQYDVEAAILAAQSSMPAGVALQTRMIARPAPEVVAAALQRPAGTRTLRPFEA